MRRIEKLIKVNTDLVRIMLASPVVSNADLLKVMQQIMAVVGEPACHGAG